MASSILSDETLFWQGVRYEGKSTVINADEARGTPSSSTGVCNMFLIAARSWKATGACGSLYLCSGINGGIYECTQLVKETYGPTMEIVWDSNAYPSGRIKITFNNTDGGVYAILPVM